MSQKQFEEFMEAQCAAIEESAMDADEWVLRNADTFRAQWSQDRATEE